VLNCHSRISFRIIVPQTNIAFEKLSTVACVACTDGLIPVKFGVDFGDAGERCPRMIRATSSPNSLRNHVAAL